MGTSPRMATGTASAIAVDAVILLVWAGSLVHVAVPEMAQLALVGILTWTIGLLLHDPNPSPAPSSSGMMPIVRALPIVAALGAMPILLAMNGEARQTEPVAAGSVTLPLSPPTIWQAVAPAAPSATVEGPIATHDLEFCFEPDQSPTAFERCVKLEARIRPSRR